MKLAALRVSAPPPKRRKQRAELAAALSLPTSGREKSPRVDKRPALAFGLCGGRDGADAAHDPAPRFGRIGHGLELFAIAEPHRAFEAHAAEFAGRPGDDEERRMETAGAHRLRAE